MVLGPSTLTRRYLLAGREGAPAVRCAASGPPTGDCGREQPGDTGSGSASLSEARGPAPLALVRVRVGGIAKSNPVSSPQLTLALTLSRKTRALGGAAAMSRAHGRGIWYMAGQRGPRGQLAEAERSLGHNSLGQDLLLHERSRPKSEPHFAI